MRDHVVFAAVVVVAASTLVTSIGVVWLCSHATQVAAVLRRSALDAIELHDAANAAAADALLRIEELADAVRETAERVNVGTELGYQNAEAASRMEAGAVVIAHDLTAAHERADAAEGPHGAAADASARTEH